MELFKVSNDKRALKFIEKRVGTCIHAKRKREEPRGRQQLRRAEPHPLCIIKPVGGWVMCLPEEHVPELCGPGCQV